MRDMYYVYEDDFGVEYYQPWQDTIHGPMLHPETSEVLTLIEWREGKVPETTFVSASFSVTGAVELFGVNPASFTPETIAKLAYEQLLEWHQEGFRPVIEVSFNGSTSHVDLDNVK